VRHHPQVTDIVIDLHRSRSPFRQLRPADTTAWEIPSTGDERPGRAETLADIIEWLFIAFESRLGLTTIVACVHDCCRELDVDAGTTSLSRVEQRAFRRLTDLAELADPTPEATHPATATSPVSRTGPRGSHTTEQASPTVSPDVLVVSRQHGTS
jgi:hypothetical protein